MTRAEKHRMNKLQNNLTHGRGIFLEVWPEFIELRRKYLIKQGENPEDYHLAERHLIKKNK